MGGRPRTNTVTVSAAASAAKLRLDSPSWADAVGSSALVVQNVHSVERATAAGATGGRHRGGVDGLEGGRRDVCAARRREERERRVHPREVCRALPQPPPAAVLRALRTLHGLALALLQHLPRDCGTRDAVDHSCAGRRQRGDASRRAAPADQLRGPQRMLSCEQHSTARHGTAACMRRRQRRPECGGGHACAVCCRSASAALARWCRGATGMSGWRCQAGHGGASQASGNTACALIAGLGLGLYTASA